MKLYSIAEILYNMSLGMDYSDGIEYADEEIKCIEKELENLKILGYDSTFQVLENIVLQNQNIKLLNIKE